MRDHSSLGTLTLCLFLTFNKFIIHRDVQKLHFFFIFLRGLALNSLAYGCHLMGHNAFKPVIPNVGLGNILVGQGQDMRLSA